MALGIRGMADAIDNLNKRAASQGPQGELDTLLGSGRGLTLDERRMRQARMDALQAQIAMQNEQAAAQAVYDTPPEIRQQAAENKRLEEAIGGVTDALERETAALKRNAFERAVDIELRKAQVDPSSAGAAAGAA